MAPIITQQSVTEHDERLARVVSMLSARSHRQCGPKRVRSRKLQEGASTSGTEESGLAAGFVANEGCGIGPHCTVIGSGLHWCLMTELLARRRYCVRSPAVHISDGAEHTQLSVSGTHSESARQTTACI